MLRVSNSTHQKLLALLVGKGGRPLWNMGKASVSQEHLALLMYETLRTQCALEMHHGFCEFLLCYNVTMP